MESRTSLIEEFCELVKIDSLSYQEREMANYIILQLEKLGFTVLEDHAGDYYGGNCGNLYGYLQGDVEGLPLLLSAHMDTVTPGLGKKAVIHRDGKITSEGATILGADDLSGIAVILQAIKRILENQQSHRSIEVVFPIGEEQYLKGSNVFDYSLIKAKEAYVLDLSGPVGTAAVAAPTLISFTIIIYGKSAHAGFSPEEGINAIAVAAEVLTQIKQGRIDEETTLNIGMIQGGEARNIISEKCILHGEIRSMNHEKAVQKSDQLNTLLEKITKKLQARFEYHVEFGCLAYEISAEKQVVKRFQKACEEKKIQAKLIRTFGGSDNNNFVKNKIQGIVVACGMNQVHSCEEYTYIDEMEKCTEIIQSIITSKE